jgi:hypothetical protein
VSDTVAHVGIWLPVSLAQPASVVCRCGQQWWSAQGLLDGRPAPEGSLTAPSMGQACAVQDQSGTQPSKRRPSPRLTAGPETARDEHPGQRPRASRSTPAIALRPATPADAEFCYQLHEAATGDYITAIWGWDEQVQRTPHERAFNLHRWRIITAGAGRCRRAGCRLPPGGDLLVPHRNPPRPPRPRHRHPDHRRASG